MPRRFRKCGPLLPIPKTDVVLGPQDVCLPPAAQVVLEVGTRGAEDPGSTEEPNPVHDVPVLEEGLDLLIDAPVGLLHFLEDLELLALPVA